MVPRKRALESELAGRDSREEKLQEVKEGRLVKRSLSLLICRLTSRAATLSTFYLHIILDQAARTITTGYFIITNEKNKNKKGEGGKCWTVIGSESDQQTQ